MSFHIDDCSYRKLIEACDRLLSVEKEVSEIPTEQREWFFGKIGHRDCFLVARALIGILEK